METFEKRDAWNKGKLVGQKPPLKPKDIWAIRIHLQNANAVRDIAIFNLAIDSKLRGCDLVSLRVRDVALGNRILPRAMVIQKKTQRSVQFELTEPTRTAVAVWLGEDSASGGPIPLPEQGAEFSSCVDPPIREDGPSLDWSRWPRFVGLRNALDAAD